MLAGVSEKNTPLLQSTPTQRNSVTFADVIPGHDLVAFHSPQESPPDSVDLYCSAELASTSKRQDLLVWPSNLQIYRAPGLGMLFWLYPTNPVLAQSVKASRMDMLGRCNVKSLSNVKRQASITGSK